MTTDKPDTGATTDLTAVLDLHVFKGWSAGQHSGSCHGCDWTTDTLPRSRASAEHRAHLAEVLEPLIREQRAEFAAEAADAWAQRWGKEGRHYGLPGCYSHGYELDLRRRAEAERRGEPNG